jgi:hypothetical protein
MKMTTKVTHGVVILSKESQLFNILLIILKKINLSDLHTQDLLFFNIQWQKIKVAKTL